MLAVLQRLTSTVSKSSHRFNCRNMFFMAFSCLRLYLSLHFPSLQSCRLHLTVDGACKLAPPQATPFLLPCQFKFYILFVAKLKFIFHQWLPVSTMYFINCCLNNCQFEFYIQSIVTSVVQLKKTSL